jgi:hypothetical protein
MQFWLLQIMQLIQYSHVSLFSTVITNEFIGGEFYLSQHSMDGYEAMGFDVTHVTQDVEQILFTIKTNMPIPVLMYGDNFQWEKYGHHILPSNLDLTSHNKTDIHQTFQTLTEFLLTDIDGHLLPSNLDLASHNKAGPHQTYQNSLVEFLCPDFLIEFLHTDFEGNLSFTLNPLTASKLDHFLLTLPKGLSETANKDKEFDQHFLNENKKRKHCFINEIVAIALSATQIPLSIFTNLFHKRFEKHSMLESMLELL